MIKSVSKQLFILCEHKRPNRVKTAVEKIINQLKVLENYGFSSNKVKHVDMVADIINMVLYKKRTTPWKR